MFEPHPIRLCLALAAGGLLAQGTTAQVSYDCDMFVTQETPGQALTFHGVSGSPTGLFAQDANANFMAIHHGNATQPMLVGSRGSGVLEFDRNTGGLIKVYNQGGGWQWAGVFAANGDVLIGDMSTSDIRRYDPSSGAFLSVFAPNINGPADMRFGPGGNLFVCAYLGGGVYELDGTTGTQIAHHVPTLQLANDILFMPDGRRIVTSMASNQAHVFDASWNQIATFAGTNWMRPHGLDRSPHDGNIYVVDGVTQAVHRFDATTYAELNATFAFVEGKLVDVEFRRSGNPVCGNLITFGPGCGGLQIAHTGRPEIGNTLTLRLGGAPPLAPVFLTAGDSNTHWNGLPLPLPLGAFGAPGCSVLVSPLIFLPSVADPSGEAQLPLALPAAPNLIAASLFFQWLALAQQSGAWTLTTSNAVECRVGG